jgi:anaphase-promoting complex subunit 3
MADCIMYLLAKCCIDLNQFHEAEEYLLQQAKLDYSLYKKTQKRENSNGNANANGNSGPNPESERIAVKSFEEWLGHLSPVNHPNPVPNGAAGFHLLGIICQRTMRPKKGKVYHELALRFDPMLWMSYDALCEMGVALTLPGSTYNSATGMHTTGDNDQEEKDDGSNGIDPVSIFGVIPQALTNIPASQGGYGTIESMQEARAEEESKLDLQRQMGGEYTSASPFSLNHSPIGMGIGNETGHMMEGMDVDPNMTMTSAHPHPDESFKMAGVAGRLSFGVSTTPMPAGNGNGNGHGHEDVNASTQTPGLRGTSLFHGNLNLSTIRKPSARMGTTSRRSSGLPSAALFNTPSLTSFTPRNHENEEKEVLRRARQVAGRRYYEPSPETTPPNRIRTTTVPHSSLKLTRRKMRRRFVGAEYDEKYDFDNSIAAGGDVTSDIGDRPKGGRFLFENSMDVTASSPAPATAIGVETTAEKDWAVVKTAKKKVPSARKLSRVKEDESKEESSVQTQPIGIGSGEDGGVQYILELLCTFGAAQRLLCAFKCKEAIQILHTLPHSHFQTGWVQHQVGRAYFYSVDYANAQRALETMQEVEPHRMKGLDLLSTTYYLLKKEVELSNLAQRAVEFDRMAPETWCIVGNCFSQQKEHKTALAFLRRSIQLDPRFTYAHTLSGHEYVANEDFDHAIASFRTAIRVDERHYNAWNGLGEIYFRQEKYDLAESHFKKALLINPQGSVIRCNLGQAQHANGKHDLALQTLALVDKRNPQAQFQRANILISMDRLTEALKELEKVRDTAPKEGSIHFAMGRVLKKLGKPEKAMRCFLTALDLDPKENTLIKSAIDRLDEPDMDEDVSAF